MKKSLVLVLVGLLIGCGCARSVSAQSQAASSTQDKQTKQARKIKGIISQLGVGSDALVELKLRDKSKLKGYVSEYAEDHFVVTDKETSVATTVKYEEVERVGMWRAVKTKINRDLSSPGRVAKKIAVGAAVTAGVVVLVCVIAHCEQ